MENHGLEVLHFFLTKIYVECDSGPTKCLKMIFSLVELHERLGLIMRPNMLKVEIVVCDNQPAI